MDVHKLVNTTRDALTARRLFGNPDERDGVTVIPAAVLRGGVGAAADRTIADSAGRAAASG